MAREPWTATSKPWRNLSSSRCWYGMSSTVWLVQGSNSAIEQMTSSTVRKLRWTYHQSMTLARVIRWRVTMTSSQTWFRTLPKFARERHLKVQLALETWIKNRMMTVRVGYWSLKWMSSNISQRCPRLSWTNWKQFKVDRTVRRLFHECNHCKARLIDRGCRMTHTSIPLRTINLIRVIRRVYNLKKHSFIYLQRANSWVGRSRGKRNRESPNLERQANSKRCSSRENSRTTILIIAWIKAANLSCSIYKCKITLQPCSCRAKRRWISWRRPCSGACAARTIIGWVANWWTLSRSIIAAKGPEVIRAAKLIWRLRLVCLCSARKRAFRLAWRLYRSDLLQTSPQLTV